MVKKRITALLLIVSLLFGLLGTQAFAADAADSNTLVNVNEHWFYSITLSQNYISTEKSSKNVKLLQDNNTNSLQEQVITLSDATDAINFTCRFEPISDGDFYRLYEIEPSVSEDGTVSLNLKRACTDTIKPTEANAVVSSDLPTSGELSVDASVSVPLADGNGTTKCLALYYGRISDVQSVDNALIVTRSYNLLGLYRFRFVLGTQEVDPTPTITKDLRYGGHLCEPNGTLEPLSVEATAAEGVELSYQWYKGENSSDVTEAINGANKSSYTPPTSTIGTTYYKVIVTGKSGERSGSVSSAIGRVVVREYVERAFELTGAFNQKVEKLAGSDSIYYLKWPTASIQDTSPLALGAVLLTGVLPDGVTIDNVWSGATADRFNLTDALTVDDETGEFRLLAQTYDTGLDATEVWHSLGKCYYFQLSTGEVYTLVVDNDYRTHEDSTRPRVVELIDESSTETTIPESFIVGNLQSYSTTTSVVSGDLTSEQPVVLRAQVQSGGDDLSAQRVSKYRAAYRWDKAQSSWVVVNGKRLPASGFFSGNANDAEGYSSPAFTLNPGLNVVEVYTDTFSFFLDPRVSSATTGLGDRFIDRLGNPSDTPVFYTTSVVYLINYTGPSATTLPSETSDASLAPVAALRFGDLDSMLETCPLVWNDETKEYTLALPVRYRKEANSIDYYSHAVLLSLRTSAAGASASIVTDLSGFIVGKQVGSCVFLNMEALKKQENPGFTIRVVSADQSVTEDYPVKIVYASSSTDSAVTLNGNVTLDTTFAPGTYSYYLDYANANVTGAAMIVTIPDNASATVNGMAYTSGSEIKLDPKVDFYRLTITAEDNYTVTSYYFVTRYTDTKVIPYQTVSDSSKALAKEMLSGWYDELESSNKFGNYWRIFMAKATGNRDGSEYDFNGAYVENPATHGMNQATDWAACIMEIVMLGYNPYSFPYGNNPSFNYVQALIDCGGGPWANNVWYHMASLATGAERIMLDTMKANAMERTHDLDTRGWVIASLSGSEPTKEMVRYVDRLHDVQDTSGTYTSLWTNQGWHGASSGNRYTIGCVLSAIASSGTDPDKLFALGDNTPLQTIRNVMYKDGLFYGNSSNTGVLPKDMVIGLGDILKGSNVWARYALTEQKYNDLKAKAQELNAQGASITIPGEYVAQDAACGKAYYDLYDAVYAALVAAGRTTEAKEMRPDVIWGMPQEVFADEVNKMPEASELKAENLADLEKLIAQYEAMDDSNRKAVASDVLSRYQALVKRGLALKAEGTTADSGKISKIYDEILALPAASEITESNVEATLAKVKEIEQEIGTLREEEKSLLTWMDNSLLQKLADIKKAAPKPDITVTFTLLGDTHHTITDDSNIHSYRFNAGHVWVKQTTVTVAEGSTVGDVFKQVLDNNGLKYTGLVNGYIDSITYTDNTKLTAKDDSRDKSGWLYLVQPKDGKATHPNVGLNAYELSDGDKIIWHWSDDYQIEQGSEHWSASRVVDYVANLYDLAEMEQDAATKAELQKKADAAYGVLGSEAELLPLQSQVDTLRAVRKSVRNVTALIKGITDWTVPADYSNKRLDVIKWVQDKLNTELADQLDGVSVTASIGVYDITPSKPGVDGKFTATIYLSKEVTADSGDKLSSKNEQTIRGVLKASAALSSDTGVSSVTVCNTLATASEDGSTYTVTVPYGSTVTAESFAITLSSDAASVTESPAETEESGVWTFTVTAENGTTADYTVKVLVAADPAEGNKAAVDAAKAMLEKASFIYASKDVNTEAAAKVAVERQIGALFGDADISYEVTMTGFTAAEDGTLWSEPTNGSFSFTVKLTKGENDSYAEANVSLPGTITAASKPVTPPTPSKPTKPSTKPTDEPAKPDASKFVDVSKNNWYFDAVQYVLENGLMNGTSANEFSPNANTTRSMIVTILARMEGVNASGGATWYAHGREWAMGAGASDGTNMEGKITREQLAAMLYRYAKLKGYDVSASADISAYTDASSVSGWATDAMRWAVGAGLINGRTATTLAPQGNATRAEVAAILMRFAQKIVK